MQDSCWWYATILHLPHQARNGLAGEVSPEANLSHFLRWTAPELMQFGRPRTSPSKDWTLWSAASMPTVCEVAACSVNLDHLLLGQT